MCLKHCSDFKFLCNAKVKHDLGLKLAKNDLFLTVLYIICTRVCVCLRLFLVIMWLGLLCKFFTNGKSYEIRDRTVVCSRGAIFYMVPHGWSDTEA